MANMRPLTGRTVADHKALAPLISLVVAFSVLVAMLLKTPELSTPIVSELSRLLQSPAVRTHLDIVLTFRYHEQMALESLSQKLASSDWWSIEIDAGSLSLGPKINYILVAAGIDVSVIVPTWNEQKYLPKCLESLRNQTGNVTSEAIVVDGGSTDNTVQIAENHADKVFVKPRQRVGAARNTGAKEASGRILAFIDADTYASPEWLSAIDQAFKDPTTIGVTGPTLPYQANIFDTFTYTFWTIYLQRILISLGMPHVIGFNCAYRRQPFLHVGGFDEASVMSEDIRLARKIRKYGRIAFEKEMYAMTSPRRFRRYGHLYIAGLYLLNGFSTLLMNKSSKSYPPVR